MSSILRHTFRSIQRFCCLTIRNEFNDKKKEPRYSMEYLMQKVFEINANTHTVSILFFLFFFPSRNFPLVTSHISRSISIFDRDKGTRATFLSLFLPFLSILKFSFFFLRIKKIERIRENASFIDIEIFFFFFSNQKIENFQIFD